VPQHHLLTVEQGAKHLQAGGVIAYPTEAVFGLGCDPENEQAVRTILSLKSRRQELGLILISDSFDRLIPFVKPVPDKNLQTALASWPGPFTWLFPREENVPDWLAGDNASIAIRVTAHPTCQALSAAFGSAIVSTSANPHGSPAATRAEQVADYFGMRISGIVAGETGQQAHPSEIRDVMTGTLIRGGSS